MVVPNDAKFSRWTFSLEASELENELHLSQETKNSELPQAWKLLMRFISSKQTEDSDADVECLSDSSVSTDVDEEEWEDLRVYTKECAKLKESSHDSRADSVDLESENNERLTKLSIDDEETNDDMVNEFPQRKAKKLKTHTKLPYNYNVFSQVLCSQDINEPEEKPPEHDVISTLKDAVTKEEPDVEEVAELLRAPNMTKQHVTELWAGLESNNSARLCLCSVMADRKLRIVFLCQKLLTPWLSNGETQQLNEVVRKVSAVIPKFPDMAIKHLIGPLIMDGSTLNPFVKDTYLLQDIMSCLEAKHWMLLLKDLTMGGMKLEKPQMPLLELVIKSSGDLVTSDPETLYRLFGLINLSMTDYTKDRDFGLLIMTVIDCVAKTVEVLPNIIESLKDITNSYKGPMRFKIGNLMKQMNDNMNR